MRHVFPKALRRVTILPVAAAIALLTFAAPATAQLSTIGSALQLLGSTNRGSDASFDPVNGRYLVVGAYGPVTGIFVDLNGTPVGGAFTISSGGHANYPRVRYSPHVAGNAGGYLVTWANEDGAGGNVNVHVRIVTASGALGAEQVISDASRARLESGAAVDYSTTSRRFLVSWATPGLAIKARAVDLNGTGLGTPVLLSTSGYGRDPGVAWNPYRDEFGVSFSGEGASGGFSVLTILPAGNPENFRRTTFNVKGGGVLTFITDLAFSTATHRFIMTWYEAIKTLAAEFDEDGSLVRSDLVTARVGLYDSLSIAYNPASQTFLMVGLDPSSDRLTGAELDGYGRKIGNEATFAGASAFYARVASSLVSPHWLAMMARTFKLTSIAVVSSTPQGTLAGAPTAPAPAPTPEPNQPPAPSSCPGSVPGMTCVNGNWVPDSGAGGSTGGGSSCPGSVPGMTCVNGEWVPGGGGGGNTGGCPGSVPGMTCVNGEWVPGGSASLLPICVGGSPAPVAGWVRIGLFDWLPAEHPLARTATCRAN